MRPTKNWIMCPCCGRSKIMFKTEKQALNFIKFNRDAVEKEGTHLRPYYCDGCGAWHISSKPHKDSYDHVTQNLINAYEFSIHARKRFNKRESTCLVIICFV